MIATIPRKGQKQGALGGASGSARSVIDYILAKHHNILAREAVNVSGGEPRAWAQEFALLADSGKRKNKLQREVHHSILSWSDEEAEKLGPEGALDLARRFAAEMYGAQWPAVIALHRDVRTGQDGKLERGKMHAHIAAAWRDHDGHRIDDFQFLKRSMKWANETATREGLEAQPIEATGVRGEHVGEVAQMHGRGHGGKQTPSTPKRGLVGGLIDDAILASGGDRERFVDLLANPKDPKGRPDPERRIAVQWHTHDRKPGDERDPYGVTFSFQGTALKGSALGKAYRYRAIAERLEAVKNANGGNREAERGHVGPGATRGGVGGDRRAIKADERGAAAERGDNPRERNSSSDARGSVPASGERSGGGGGEIRPGDTGDAQRNLLSSACPRVAGGHLHLSHTIGTDTAAQLDACLQFFDNGDGLRLMARAREGAKAGDIRSLVDGNPAAIRQAAGKLLPAWRGMNAGERADFWIKPMSASTEGDRHRYLVLDDLDRAQLDALPHLGRALAVSSSRGNYGAIIQADREMTREERAATERAIGEAIRTEANRPDTNAMDGTHGIRLPGFKNWKAPHGKQTFAYVAATAEAPPLDAAAWLAYADPTPAPRERGRVPIAAPRRSPAVARSQSEIDFGRACGSWRAGKSWAQIASELLESPRLEERHPKTWDYIKRTTTRSAEATGASAETIAAIRAQLDRAWTAAGPSAWDRIAIVLAQVFGGDDGAKRAEEALRAKHDQARDRAAEIGEDLEEEIEEAEEEREDDEREY